jgi:hypothetical protein
MKKPLPDDSELYPDIPANIRTDVADIFRKAKATYPDSVTSQNSMIRQALIEGWAKAAEKASTPPST